MNFIMYKRYASVARRTIQSVIIVGEIVPKIIAMDLLSVRKKKAHTL